MRFCNSWQSDYHLQRGVELAISRKTRVALTRSLPEEVRTAREAELRAAAREYEAELLAIFDRLPKWNTTEDGQLRHHYWDGKKWTEYDLKNPPLWVVESIDPK